MTSIERDNDASIADLLAASSGWANSSERVTATYAVVGLTNFGEHSVPSTRGRWVPGRLPREPWAVWPLPARSGLRGRGGPRRGETATLTFGA